MQQNFFCFNRINSYLQLNVWCCARKQSKQIYCKYFIMNILKYTRDQMQHRRTQREKKKKHIQVTNAIWKIHTMNIKQIQEKTYSIYNIYLKWIFVEIFSAQLIRMKEIKPSKSKPERWTHL